MSSELSKWPNEAQAAEMIGASTKTVLRYVQAGKIEMRKRARRGLKPENVFNPADLQRLLPPAHVMPSETPIETDGLPAPLKSASANGVLAIIRTIATAIETERQTVQMPKLWLTLEEAAEISGLRPSYLRDSCVDPEYYEEGRNLIGVRGGPHGALRIRRASLQAFAG